MALSARSKSRTFLTRSALPTNIEEYPDAAGLFCTEVTLRRYTDGIGGDALAKLHIERYRPRAAASPIFLSFPIRLLRGGPSSLQIENVCEAEGRNQQSPLHPDGRGLMV